jgi:replicative DNA helicase
LTMETRPSPHSEAAERAVIGTVLVAGSEVLPELRDLSGRDFFFEHHATAWEAIEALNARGARVDLVSVQDEVRALGTVARLPDGLTWLLTVARESTAPEAALTHAVAVRKLAALRRLVALCVETESRACSMADLDDVMATMRDGLANLESAAGTTGAERIADLMDAVTDEIQARAGQRTVDHLAKTGLGALDHLIGNFRRGHVVTVGGLPGMGKSSFARAVVEYNARNHIPGVVFSNEMDRGEWLEALISLRSHVPATNIGRGRIEYSEWRNKILPTAKKLCDYPLWLDDRVLTANQTCGEAHRWFNKCVRRQGRDYGLIVIDYLNLVQSDEKSENRNREVARMLARFKRLAKDLRTTCIVVAQLNRKAAIENREPVMSDFRDCGEIESMSDLIICPWREGYGKPRTKEYEDGVRAMGYENARLLLLKQKGGAVGGVDAAWYRERMEYADVPGHVPTEPMRRWNEPVVCEDE